MMKIIACAVVFHLLVIGICIAFHFVNFKHEPEPIPVFEMVQVQQAVQPRPQPPRPKPPEPKPPEPKPLEPKPKPEPKPKVDQQLPPEPKIEEKPPEPEPVEEPKPEPEPEPQDDFEVDDLDLPTAVEAPSLNPVGSVDMDPLMQVYLERLKQIIMSNFNPPSNLNVRRDVKTTVQFTVDRFGGITAITLKRSSGNKTWDHLSVRAVQISKVPELPPNFRAPSLVLHFNFTPN
ncbi:MAG: TonB C-terminal domain-containing protein [Fibrobacter sp.]|nr:TonB C-terminal domain-containing protein [Fibrobacter sp.]